MQNELFVFGRGEDVELRSQWFFKNKLNYVDSFIEDVDESEFDEDAAGEQLTSKYIEMIMDVVKNLHDSGIIKSLFPKLVPIIIYGLHYSRPMAEKIKLLTCKSR